MPKTNYEKKFKEAFDLIEAIKPYSDNMSDSLKKEIKNFLKKNSQTIYGIKNFLNE